ncbi:Ras GTPase-activating protein [Entamoeba marina]
MNRSYRGTIQVKSAHVDQVALNALRLNQLSPRSKENGFVFWEMCRLYDFYLLRALIRYPSTTSPEYWDAIRDLLEESGQIYRVLSEEFFVEVTNTTEEQFLLRSNSGATHLLTSVLRRDLTSLLEKHINPIIQSVNQISDVIDLDSIDENVSHKSKETISKLLHLHVTRFLSLHYDVPSGVKYLFASLRKAVSDKFPNSAIPSISFIIFHRLITPALVSPANFNSCLTSIKKKPTLIHFNEYVESMYTQMNEFLDKVSTETNPPIVHKPPILPKQILQASTRIIVNQTSLTAPALIQNFINHAKEDGKLGINKTKPTTIFSDHTYDTYIDVVNGFDKTIQIRINKINELSDEIFLLKATIERYAVEHHLDMDDIINEYNPYKKLPPPLYTYENCGLGNVSNDINSILMNEISGISNSNHTTSIDSSSFTDAKIQHISSTSQISNNVNHFEENNSDIFNQNTNTYNVQEHQQINLSNTNEQSEQIENNIENTQEVCEEIQQEDEKIQEESEQKQEIEELKEGQCEELNEQEQLEEEIQEQEEQREELHEETEEKLEEIINN